MPPNSAHRSLDNLVSKHVKLKTFNLQVKSVKNLRSAPACARDETSRLLDVATAHRVKPETHSFPKFFARHIADRKYICMNSTI